MAAALASCSSSCIATVSPSSQLRVYTSRNASSSSMPQLRRFVANPPLRSISSQRLAVSSQLTTEKVKADGQQVVASTALAGALFATLADVGSAQAAQEVMQLATDDTRGYLLLLPLLVALGWVGFNILTPALNQIDRMRGAKGVAAGLGLGAAASLLVAPQADAAEEIMQLAASDNRAFILLVVLLPAVGWVLFNIAGPAANQWTKLVGGGGKKRSVAGALGLGGAASLLLAPQADAAQEIMDLAASDNRAFILLVVLFPALGWVLYNIGGPALNQVNKLRGLKSVAGAVGLGAVGSMALAEQADAAEEIMQLAAGDNRAALLLVVLLPAVGWVLYNITGPALNQVNKLLNKGGKVGGKK
eukprot:TRINITY_DN9265_c0_g1_i1.p1 TRINITY_DN9265_c0_g1~~TRINITY_DN9265_c0_g1_i1.p1  ORF type:complete len:410 (+),score=118.77 TRINITY_DN9265_c0_g1_i1:149-1231(+)